MLWSIDKRLARLRAKLALPHRRGMRAAIKPPILMLPAPDPAPPAPRQYRRREPSIHPAAGMDTAVLCGYGFNAPNPLPRGTFSVSLGAPLHIHCWCERHYYPTRADVRHNNWPDIQVENYTVFCPSCRRHLICCGFADLSNSRGDAEAIADVMRARAAHRGMG